MTNPVFRKSAVIIFVLVAVFFASRSASIAGGLVTTCDEASLRFALMGGGTVVFACDGSITLSNTLVITTDTALDASGYSVTLSGGDKIRIIDVDQGASLALKNLTLAHGFVLGTNGGIGAEGESVQGGAVRINGGTLDVSNCRFWTNVVVGGVGGIPMMSNFGSEGGTGSGGAIYANGGTLNITNSDFTGNRTIGGPGVTNTAQITITGTEGGASLGGAIRSTNASVYLESSSFELNEAIGGLAGEVKSGNAGRTGSARGGAVMFEEGTCTIKNSRFIGNESHEPMPIGPLGGSGGSAQGGAFFGNSTVTIIDTEFVANRALGGDARRHIGTAGFGLGGAVFNVGDLEVSGCLFQQNFARGGYNGLPAGDGCGGAVFNLGDARISRTVFTQNYVQAGQGYFGGYNPISHGLAKGGAILNGDSLILYENTLSENKAFGADGGIASFTTFSGSNAYGGALFTEAMCWMTNNTFFGNVARGGVWNLSPPPPFESSISAGGDGLGGAVFNQGGTLFSVNNTIAGNVAAGGEGYPAGTGHGGGFSSTNGVLQVINTLLSENLPANSAPGELSDLGHNLSSDSSCAFSQLNSINDGMAHLGVLNDYGGRTPTMALLEGSQAIDAGDSTHFPLFDQRGRARPFGTAADIGAFESSPPYVIRGTISGATLQDEVTVGTSLMQVVTTNSHYSLEGLTADIHAVTPQDQNYLFVPASQSIVTGPDQLNVNFRAYRWNALSLDEVTNGVLHIAYAATNGQTVVLQSSMDLSLWTSNSTNVIGSSNLWNILLPIGFEAVRFYRTSTH